MKKTIFVLIILLCSLLLTSIASAQLKLIPLDIISNFLNSILRIFGITSTAQKTIPSSGTIVYVSPTELGVWYVPTPGQEKGSEIGFTLPADAKWTVAREPDYTPKPGVNTILSWNIRSYSQPIKTASDISSIVSQYKGQEQALKKFWGVIFLSEEQFRYVSRSSSVGGGFGIIMFNDGVNADWFDEKLVGFDIYKQTHPSATQDDWRDEMYLRMVRGFYNYIDSLGIKVGITIGYPSIMDRPRGYGGYLDFLGAPAMTYLKANSDFVIVYRYTINLDKGYPEWPGDNFLETTKPYLSVLDSNWTHPLKLWIITRYFAEGGRFDSWERAAIALEMKNLLDRGWVILTYSPMSWDHSGYDFQQYWNDMHTCMQLYKSTTPYYETLVYGTNKLTGEVGNTYGWVE